MRPPAWSAQRSVRSASAMHAAIVDRFGRASHARASWPLGTEHVAAVDDVTAKSAISVGVMRYIADLFPWFNFSIMMHSNRRRWWCLIAGKVGAR